MPLLEAPTHAPTLPASHIIIIYTAMADVRLQIYFLRILDLAWGRSKKLVYYVAFIKLFFTGRTSVTPVSLST